MGNAIGEMLPSAVGVAISPLPIVAVVLMLVSARAKSNSVSFVIGWCTGTITIGALVLWLVGSHGGQQDEPAQWVGIVQLVFGLLLLFFAFRTWHHRPAKGEPPETPKWMKALDHYTPMKAAGTAIVLSAANPKNLMLTAAGAAAMAQAGLETAEQAFVMLVFVVIASLGVAVPVLLYLILGDRSRHMLDEVKDWLSTHNAAIMAVLLLIMGAKVLGNGISAIA